jgi:DNA-binding winged helix-turn-helix (wHTH) protein/TolB-like protein
VDAARLRFGQFDFAPATGELRRDGRPVRLQPQPRRVLALLLSRAGELVTREEMQLEVWGTGTYVDFDRGLNFCIAQIRSALKDSAESPRYLQTIPKQGYVFIAPVSRESVPAGEAPAAAPARRPSLRQSLMLAIALVAGVAAAVGTYSLVRTPPVPTVIVIPFYDETANRSSVSTALALGDAVVTALADSSHRRTLSVIGNAPSLRSPFAREDVQDIARRLDAEFLIIGQLKSDGSRFRLVAHLIRAADMKHLWANNYDDSSFGLDAQTAFVPLADASPRPAID